MTAKTHCERQANYIRRKRLAGYCAKCFVKSDTFHCEPCRLKHNERIRAYYAKIREEKKKNEPIL